MSENLKFAELDRATLDKLNDLQHEVTDTRGNGVILVAYNRDCACGKDCHCR